MKKGYTWIWILIIMLWAGIVSATSTPTPTTQNQDQDQSQEQQQGQIQGQAQQATGVGIGTGIADSTAISGSNSTAIVGVNSENENTNNNANMNTAFGGQGGTGVAYSTVINEVASPIAEAGDSQAEAYAAPSISDVNMGDINAGNSFESSYFNSQKLDSYDTFIQVGNTRKSVPNISGYAGMNRYNYRDSWEFGIRMTIPLFTGVTDKAIEYETNKLNIENNYLNAQITALNADRQRADEQSQLAIEKATLDIALLCEPFLQGLNVLDKTNSTAYGICKNYELRKPREVEKIVEKEPKPSPCELCEKENKLIIQTRPNQ